MTEPTRLPYPRLGLRAFGPQAIPLFTDEALLARTGVRVAFTGRSGGVSEGPYAELNLGGHVGDDPQAVSRNRGLLLAALGAPGLPVVVPNQVHGDELVEIDGAQADRVEELRRRAQQGADGLVVTTAGVAALLCFADCVPVVLVSASGRFAVVHAGWRGVLNGVAAKAAGRLAALDAPLLGSGAARELNVYVGPHIHAECFETGADVRARFVERFGAACAPDERHVDLFCALTAGLVEAGVDAARIAEAGVCTMCSADGYYSYRASGGVCGRHGALAFRKG